MKPSLIAQLISDSSSKDSVDLRNIVQTLGIKIKLSNEIVNHCEIRYLSGDESPTVFLNKDLDVQTQQTFVAIALAEYILTPVRVTNKGICYDMFFLNDTLHQQQFSYRMLLATRLVIPKCILEIMHTDSALFDDFVFSSNYLPRFLRSCVQDSTALFLLSNFSDLPNLSG